MFAHRLIVILVIIALGYLLYKVTMAYLKKRFSAAFQEEQRQTLRTRLNKLFQKRDELRSLQMSVKVTAELNRLEAEIKKLTKQLTKLETKKEKKK
jgi:septal ring factor EnvC (AmiA/AmiB activator)